MFLLMRKICRIGGACLARGVGNLVGHGHDGNITTARTAGSRDVREAEPVQARQLPIVAACQRREWRVRGPLLLRAKGHHAEGQCCARIGVDTICRADERIDQGGWIERCRAIIGGSSRSDCASRHREENMLSFHWVALWFKWDSIFVRDAYSRAISRSRRFVGVEADLRGDGPSRSVVGLCLSKYQSIASSLVPTPLRAIFSCAR